MAVRSRFFIQVDRFSVLFPLLEEEGEIYIDLKSSATHYESGVAFDYNASPYPGKLRIPYPISDTEMVTILQKLAAKSYKAASGEATQRMLDNRPEFGVKDPERGINDNPQRLSKFQSEVFGSLLENWEKLKDEIPALLRERKRCRNLLKIEREMINQCPFLKGQKVLYKDREFTVSDIQVSWGNDYSPSLKICINQLNRDGWIVRSCYVSPEDLVPY